MPNTIYFLSKPISQKCPGSIPFTFDVSFSLLFIFQGKSIFLESRLVNSENVFDSKHGCVDHFVSLAILRRKCNNLVDQLSAPLRVDASRHFATDSSPSKFLQGHDNSNTSLFKTFHSHTRARDGGKREKERGRPKRRKRKGRNPNTYRRNCYGIPLQAIVNLRKVARDCKIAWLTLVG